MSLSEWYVSCKFSVCRFTPQNSLAAVHYHTAAHRVRSKNSASSGLVTSESLHWLCRFILEVQKVKGQHHPPATLHHIVMRFFLQQSGRSFHAPGPVLSGILNHLRFGNEEAEGCWHSIEE